MARNPRSNTSAHLEGCNGRRMPRGALSGPPAVLEAVAVLFRLDQWCRFEGRGSRIGQSAYALEPSSSYGASLALWGSSFSIAIKLPSRAFTFSLAGAATSWEQAPWHLQLTELNQASLSFYQPGEQGV